ncbi:MAG: aspartyl-phosphate phosphatase Spo0E family protein [Bacillota bacterium]
MKNEKYTGQRDYINQMRRELHHLIECEDNLTSTIVQKKSRELDNLILMYYGRNSVPQESSDP